MYVLPEDFLWLEEKCNPLLQYNWILLSETGIFCIEHDKRRTLLPNSHRYFACAKCNLTA